MPVVPRDPAGLLASAYAERASFEYAYSWWQVVGTLGGTVLALTLAGRDEGVQVAYLWMAIAGVVVTGLGVTLGLHRLYSHRSFRARRPLELSLFVLGTAAGQGYPIRWVYDHRIHHRFTDVPGDPHSPCWRGEHRLRPIHGFLHAHFLWLFRVREPVQGDVVRDLADDATLVALDRAAPLIVATGLLVPGLIGALVESSPMGFLRGVLWGGTVRMFLLNHFTWSVNSVCHMLGEKPAGLANEARNNPLVGILALGEGWHGNHHLDPSSARHGWRWYEVDFTWVVLRILENVGVINSVRRPRSAMAGNPRDSGGGVTDALLASQCLRAGPNDFLVPRLVPELRFTS